MKVQNPAVRQRAEMGHHKQSRPSLDSVKTPVRPEHLPCGENTASLICMLSIKSRIENENENSQGWRVT